MFKQVLLTPPIKCSCLYREHCWKQSFQYYGDFPRNLTYQDHLLAFKEIILRFMGIYSHAFLKNITASLIEALISSITFRGGNAFLIWRFN